MRDLLTYLPLEGIFVFFFYVGIAAIIVVRKRVPGYSLAKARASAKENTRHSWTTLLAFTGTPVLTWFAFGKNASLPFFIVVGYVEMLGLVLFLGEVTEAG